MSQAIWALIFGIGFGLAATLPPGPINTEIARRTLKFGWLPGVMFGLGSIAVENLLALISCLGYGLQLDRFPSMLPILLFVGFMVLSIVGTITFVNGYRCWQDPSRVRIAEIAGERASPELLKTQIAAIPRNFFSGVGMAIISPYTIAFWIIGLPSAAHHVMNTRYHIVLLLLGVLIGTFSWLWGFTTMLSWLKKSSSTWWIIWVDLVGGVMLLVFAAFALLKLAQTLVQSGRSSTFLI